jgi:HlyD family secretion protein
MKTLASFLLLIGLGVGGVVSYLKYFAVDPPPNLRTATVKRGELLSVINATGTIEPEELVDVGAQVAGRIKEFGIDPNDPEKKKPIDYDSTVHDGTVLAQIDDAMYKAQVDQAEAAIVRAKADLEQLKAKLYQAEEEAKRAEILRPKNAIAETDYVLAIANYKVAKANVDVGEATIKQDKAALVMAQTNLDYTTIKSPVEGVVIDRRVNIGQTVVASLNAPSIFLIAKDLRRMQVWAAVNEADIGRIRVGMPAQFTVDTFPDDVFQGQVAQIRLNATMTQNVVTYTVVVSFDNSDLKLKPYLTANLKFQVDKRTDAILVPNAALRWKPRPDLVAEDVRDMVTASNRGRGKEGPGSAKASDAKKPADKAKLAGKAKSDGRAKSASETRPARPTRERDDRGRLWIRDENYVRPIEVQIGVSDGTMTEVRGGDVKEGMEIVLGEAPKADRSSDTANPFAPKFFRGNKRPEQKEQKG